MHRTRLIAVLALALSVGACKKEASEAQPSNDARALTASGARAGETEGSGAAGTRAIALPNGYIYAASTHLRVIDAAKGALAATVDIGKNISSIVFSKDGAQAFLATSGGVFRVDARTHKMLGQLSSSPARNLVLSSAGDLLFVLEHDVVVQPNGTREVRPYRLRTIEVANGKTRSEEEIGQRVLFALPSQDGQFSLVISEGGLVFAGAAGTKLDAGRPLAIAGGEEGAALRVREGTIVVGNVAYVPVEGPSASLLEVDLVRGEGRTIPLDHPGSLRGLALTPDQKTIVVDGAQTLLLVDRAQRRVRARLELELSHQGIAVAPNGQYAYLAQTVDGTGGAVGLVALEPLAYRGKVHLDDISPWTIAVSPR